MISHEKSPVRIKTTYKRAPYCATVWPKSSPGAKRSLENGMDTLMPNKSAPKMRLSKMLRLTQPRSDRRSRFNSAAPLLDQSRAAK